MELEFYTIEDIAEILKISINTARQLVNAKGFPKLKFGRTIRIPKDKFNSWINTYTDKEFMI